MSFDLDKLQAVAELGEVIRLHNDAVDKLQAFRKERPHLIMPNLAKIVEENLKENMQILYKELNNLHRPAEQQTRYICNECKMAFLVRLPGGICDECRARLATKPRDYTVHATPVDMNEQPAEEAPLAETAELPVDEQTQPETSEPVAATQEDVMLAKPDAEATEAADEVAHDLTVAEEAPVENSEGEVINAPKDEHEYELSFDGEGEFSFDDLKDDDGDGGKK